MDRFFFHVFDDIEARDDDGEELPDLDAARAWAMAGARSLACEQVERGCLDLRHRIDIADVSGQILASVSFREAVSVRS